MVRGIELNLTKETYTMNTYDIVGYIYEAAVHCDDCTAKRFPRLKGIDCEGNDVTPYTIDDASNADSSTHCNDCHAELYELEPVRELLLDGNRGVYIPSNFASNFNMTAWHVDADDVTVLRAGPDHADYWDVWDRVLNDAYFIDADGRRWTLEQDDDLWVISVR